MLYGYENARLKLTAQLRGFSLYFPAQQGISTGERFARDSSLRHPFWSAIFLCNALRLGVNWGRLKSRSIIDDRVLMNRVFAIPGSLLINPFPMVLGDNESLGTRLVANSSRVHRACESQNRLAGVLHSPGRRGERLVY